ncbi:MAG: hypothetical protein JWM09_942 [Francisellaceae bacterium]|nr:hypothetical protein [Francisellaceae bacterium]
MEETFSQNMKSELDSAKIRIRESCETQDKSQVRCLVPGCGGLG